MTEADSSMTCHSHLQTVCRGSYEKEVIRRKQKCINEDNDADIFYKVLPDKQIKAL